MEETGTLRVFLDFMQSIKNIATECGIVVNTDGHFRVASGNEFGIQIIQTNEFDPDNIGFVQWLCTRECMSCVKSVL